MDEAIRDYVRVKPKLVNYYYYLTRIFMIMFDIMVHICEIIL